MKRRIALAGVLLVSAASAAPASATCMWGTWSVFFGHDATAPALADSGQPCNLRVGQDSGVIIKNFVVLRQPAHGHVAVTHQGLYAWVYTSKPGYKGPDGFLGSYSGIGPVTSGTSKITVSLDVR
jgi:hypothetical protein